MGIRVTMDSGAQYVAHEARTEGTHNGQPVSVYVVREASTGDVVGEVWRMAQALPGEVWWEARATGSVKRDGRQHTELWRAVRTVVGGKVASVETVETVADDDEPEYAPACPACGTPIDYCPGHGELGDPDGAAILRRHDDGDHKTCDPAGCDDAPASLYARIAENGRAVQVWWIPGIGVEPSRQRVAAAARAESGGHPIRYRQTFAEMGRMTAVYSRDAR